MVRTAPKFHALVSRLRTRLAGKVKEWGAIAKLNGVDCPVYGIAQYTSPIPRLLKPQNKSYILKRK